MLNPVWEDCAVGVSREGKSRGLFYGLKAVGSN